MKRFLIVFILISLLTMTTGCSKNADNSTSNNISSEFSNSAISTSEETTEQPKTEEQPKETTPLYVDKTTGTTDEDSENSVGADTVNSLKGTNKEVILVGIFNKQDIIQAVGLDVDILTMSSKDSGLVTVYLQNKSNTNMEDIPNDSKVEVRGFAEIIKSGDVEKQVFNVIEIKTI